MAKLRRIGLPKKAWLYFIQVGGEVGPIKIGYSVDVEDRLKSITTSSPTKPVLLAKFQFENVDHARHYEQRLHREVFWDLRKNGEWFECDPRILRLIQTMRMVEERNRPTGTDETVRIRSINDTGEDFR